MTESTSKAHAASPDPGVAVLLGPTDGDTEMKTFAACLALLCAAPALYAADPAVRLLILPDLVDLEFDHRPGRPSAGHFTDGVRRLTVRAKP